MPNDRVLEESARIRRRKRRSAQRLYRRYRQQVPALIQQMGTTQAAYDRAFDLLSEMGDTIVAELMASAGLDRLAHRAEILIITGSSFRA